MKKVLLFIVVLFVLVSVKEASAGVFDKKTDDSTTGTGLFETKSYNDSNQNWQRGY